MGATNFIHYIVAGTLLVSFAPVFSQSAQEVKTSGTRLPKEFKTSSSLLAPQWKYLLYRPDSYYTSSERMPMILYLHGRSLRGDDVLKIKRYGLPAILDDKKDFPFVVVSPQLPDHSWPAESLLELVEEVTRRYRIDRHRIYLTGVSMGGSGVWYLAAENQFRFAAIAPLCGDADQRIVNRVDKLPIWSFHGDQDKVTAPGPHIRLVEAINQAGGTAKITLIPGGTHGNIIYPTYQREDLYQWFLSHTRAPKPKAKPKPNREDLTDAKKPKPIVPIKRKNQYIVKKGDTLWGISQAHGVTVDLLKKANSLNSNHIQIGQILIIPVVKELTQN